MNNYILRPNMPVVLDNIYKHFSNRFINLKNTVVLNVLISKIAQMLTSKRILIDDVGRYVIPNWYSMVFVASGFGKDRLVKDLNELIFPDFRNWFTEKSRQYKSNKIEDIKYVAKDKFQGDKQENQQRAFIEAEIEKIRELVLEMADGTQEGFYSDGLAFFNADFGSLFVTISEFGKFLQSSTTEKEQFINCLFNAYDGKISSKCIKGGKREADIEGLPVNALLYSDHNLILNEVKHIVNSLLQTGLNRRSVISFQTNRELKNESMSYDIEKMFNETAKDLGKDLFLLFEKCRLDNRYILLPDSKTALNVYDQKCIDLYNKTENEFLKAEIKSRVFKSLKLSCLYACLNHPKDLTINPEDVEQAISTIEFLSQDLKELINYRPKYCDKYDKIFKFFLENIGKGFTKTSLTYKHHTEIGISRKNFTDNFDETISIVRNIAKEEGYLLQEKPINNNSGKEYKLVKIEIDDSLPDLNKLMRAS